MYRNANFITAQLGKLAQYDYPHNPPRAKKQSIASLLEASLTPFSIASPTIPLKGNVYASVLLRFLSRGSTEVLEQGANTVIFVLWKVLPGLDQGKTVGRAVSWESVAETVTARTRKGAVRQDGGREGGRDKSRGS